MNAEKLYDAFAQIDDDLLDGATGTVLRVRTINPRRIVAAAVALFVVGAGVAFYLIRGGRNNGSGVDGNSAERVQKTDFEEYLNYANDFIEGEFKSYNVENGIVYCEFAVVKDYRESGLSGTVTVHYSTSEKSSGSYKVPYTNGVSYLLLLSRHSSVFTESDDFGFVSPYIIIPAHGYEKSATLRGEDLRGRIKTQDALDAFDNGHLAEYIAEAVKDNPRVAEGTPYIMSTELEEIVAFSDCVLKIKVDDLAVQSKKGDRITGYCTVEEVMKGSIDNMDVIIVFPIDQVEKEASYIVAVCGSGSFFVVSSKSSVYDCAQYDIIKNLLANE